MQFQGKVPRNEYGNVELFLPCMLPPGTKHIQSRSPFLPFLLFCFSLSVSYVVLFMFTRVSFVLGRSFGMKVRWWLSLDSTN